MVLSDQTFFTFYQSGRAGKIQVFRNIHHFFMKPVSAGCYPHFHIDQRRQRLIPAVNIKIEIHPILFQIAGTGGFHAFPFHTAQRRKQHCSKNRDDGNYDE